MEKHIQVIFFTHNKGIKAEVPSISFVPYEKIEPDNKMILSNHPSSEQ